MANLGLVTELDEKAITMISELLERLNAAHAAHEIDGLAVIVRTKRNGLEWSRAHMSDLDVVWGSQSLIFRVMLEKREWMEDAS